MAARKRPTINDLLAGGEWAAARAAIDRELMSHPDNHWLLTQRGVTLYEEGRYDAALEPLVASAGIVPDCPLTLWNLAGTLDALGKPANAVRVYTWLLGSKRTAADDPCWESAAWADALKTDCVFRLGVCHQRSGQWAAADNCFRQYVNLLLAGMTGSYGYDDAARRIRETADRGGPRHTKAAAFAATLHDEGGPPLAAGRRRLTKRALAELLAS